MNNLSRPPVTCTCLNAALFLHQVAGPPSNTILKLMCHSTTYDLRHSSSIGNLGNIALLGIAGELGLIDAQLAGKAAAAYPRFRKLQHGLRLNNAPYARVAPEDVEAEIACVRALWRAVFDTDAP